MAPLLKPRPRVLDKLDRKLAAAKAKRDVYRQVDQRDGYTCRATGQRADPRALGMTERGHHHHIRYRSRGGQDTTANLCLLSAEAHGWVHAGLLAVSGNADKTLTFKKHGRRWTSAPPHPVPVR